VGAAIILVVGILLSAGCDRGDSDDMSGAGRTQQAADSDGAAAPPRPVVFPDVPPAPRPTGPLAQNASCVTAECHAVLANSAYIHAPVAQRSCESCHESDMGGHRYPLKRSPAATCTFCHSVAGTAEHQHAALKDGCASCHQPHVSKAKFLLKADSIAQQCAACHDVPLRARAHGPFARGDCTICHQPHQSDARFLLRGGEGPSHCFSCHGDIGSAVKGASYVHKPARGDCGACHGPHSTDYPFLLKEPVGQTCLGCHAKVKREVDAAPVAHGAMSDERSCANCHDGHASEQPQLLRDRMDRVCLTCHDKPLAAADGRVIANMKPALTESDFLHGPIRTGDCSACHQAHGGRRTDLLVRPFPARFYAPFRIEDYALCFSCHDEQLVLSERTAGGGGLTNFRDGQVNLHATHVAQPTKGRTCRTCHEVHGSDLPNHMASEVPFEGSKWAMPIAYEKRADGGSCAPGCHKPKTYSRTGPATSPVTRGEP
jgi:predicted CXXCH cytochrome family protein